MRPSIIYLVTNQVNLKRYVGVTRFPENRWRDHVRKALKNPETYFHKAISKYGPESFVVEHIVTCLRPEYGSSVERAVICDLKPEYNQTNGGEHTVGKRVPKEVVEKIKAANKGKKRTPEQRARMSASRKLTLKNNPQVLQANLEALEKARQSPNFRINHLAAVTGRSPSEETRRKLSAALLARMRGAPAPSLAIAASIKANKKRLKCLTTGQEFDCCSDAALTLDVGTSSLYKVLVGARESVKGLYFSYI